MPEAVDVDIEDRHLGPHARGDLSRTGSDHPPAEDDHAPRLDARHAPEKNAPTALGPLEVFRPLLNGELAGDLAHGGQEGQMPVIVGQGFVGDRDALAFDAAEGEIPVSGKMKIGEKRLIVANQGNFGRLGLLDLDDKVSPGPNFICRRNNIGPDRVILAVRESAPLAGAGLDQDGMTIAEQHFCSDRSHADPIFIRLHLSGDANYHRSGPS